MKILGWVIFSAFYWFFALAFAMGAMLGRCEPPKTGCDPITGEMVLGAAIALYALIILAAILLRKRRRS